MRIELQIDELVLHGVSARDRYRVSGALIHELERRLAEPGAARHFQQGSSASVVHAQGGALAPNAQPAQYGQQVASAVFGALSR